MSSLLILMLIAFLTALAGICLARLAESRNHIRPIDSKLPEEPSESSQPATGSQHQSQAQHIELLQLIETVNAMLPQSQCAQCHHPGCRPYAEAIVMDNAAINQCPPGGQPLIQQLANLLDRDVEPLDPACGEEKPRQLAVINEADCIGCTLCIQACPVDAIAGASRHMHTVIPDSCTGCELCLPPCPVDCIDLEAVEPTLQNWIWPKPDIPTAQTVWIRRGT